VAVFSILGSLSLIPLQMLGVGLAVSVLIDATVVRGVLLPAALALLGERVWPPAGPAVPAGAAEPSGELATRPAG
jgi:RND superfamily putative drug exporter